MKRNATNKRLQFIEFLLSGVLVHIIVIGLIFELLLGRGLTVNELLLAIAIIVPFSAVTEYVIDHPRFWHRLFRLSGHKFDDMLDDLKS